MDCGLWIVIVSCVQQEDNEYSRVRTEEREKKNEKRREKTATRAKKWTRVV